VIRLTATGRKLVTAALPDHLRLVNAMMSPLASKEQQELRMLLKRLDERGTP
jgi:DNA-binding MarR family transcriptional regulator